jgi:hypothetical protein
MSGCLWGQWHKLDEKTKEAIRKMMEREKKEDRKECECLTPIVSPPADPRLRVKK